VKREHRERVRSRNQKKKRKGETKARIRNEVLGRSLKGARRDGGKRGGLRIAFSGSVNGEIHEFNLMLIHWVGGQKKRKRRVEIC